MASPRGADEFTIKSRCLFEGSAGKCHANSINKSFYRHELLERHSQIFSQGGIFSRGLCARTGGQNLHKYTESSSKPTDPHTFFFFFFFFPSLKEQLTRAAQSRCRLLSATSASLCEWRSRERSLPPSLCASSFLDHGNKTQVGLQHDLKHQPRF